jgi:hypothetical protein
MTAYLAAKNMNEIPDDDLRNQIKVRNPFLQHKYFYVHEIFELT